MTHVVTAGAHLHGVERGQSMRHFSRVAPSEPHSDRPLLCRRGHGRLVQCRHVAQHPGLRSSELAVCALVQCVDFSQGKSVNKGSGHPNPGQPDSEKESMGFSECLSPVLCLVGIPSPPRLQQESQTSARGSFPGGQVAAVNLCA